MTPQPIDTAPPGDPTTMTDRSRDSLLRLAEVRERTGLSRTTIYRRISAGAFPASIPISAGLVAWYKSDVDAWIADPMGWQSQHNYAPT